MKAGKVVLALIAGLGISFCFVAGKSLDVYYTLDITQKSFYIKWLALGSVLTVCIHLLWETASGALKLPVCFINAWNRIEEKACVLEKHISFWKILLIIFVLWLPAWLAIFPGVFSYDAYAEWQQIYNGNITAHHPVLHVLFCGGGAEAAYRLTGSYNLGIAICTVIQMLVLAGVFSYTVMFLKEQRVNLLLRLFAILFYGISPVIQLFAIASTKDVFFAAAFLVFLISVFRICTKQEQFFTNKKWKIHFAVSSVFTMIMRNNGLYIVFISLVIIMWYCRKHLKALLCIYVPIILLYLVYVGPFYSLLNVTPGGIEEMLSVPIQQIARVHKYEKEEISREELEYLYTVIPQSNWEAYRPAVSDFVKSGFQGEVFGQDAGRFFSVWMKLGMKHPMTYLNSFLIGTVDYWYPFAVVDGYQDVYGKSSYFDYKVSEPGTERSLIPALYSIYESISHDKEVQKIPGMFLILSPGWYMILYLLTFLYAVRERKYGSLVFLLPILLNLGTVFLGPIALVRYVLIQFFAFPIYCVIFTTSK